MSGNVAREIPGDAERQPGRVDEQLLEVRQTELPPLVEELSNEYDRRIGDRDRFLWKWIHNLFDAFTLSCVPRDRLEDVKTTKTVLTMFVTVLDDVADRRGDRATFEQARHIPHARSAVDGDAEDVDREVVDFAEKLWKTFKQLLSAAPRYEEFEQLLQFDVREVLNAMEYAQVLNGNPEMANLNGTRHYGPHNMVMFPYADVDLMYSPRFDTTDLGELRGLIWELQQMARIGNWVTTWERELHEADYSAGVVVEAIERDLIEPTPDAEDVEPVEAIHTIKAHGIDRQFHREWSDRFEAVQEKDVDVESVDADAFIEGMRTVMEHHLASYGHK
jgi:hypothetical protein